MRTIKALYPPVLFLCCGGILGAALISYAFLLLTAIGIADTLGRWRDYRYLLRQERAYFTPEIKRYYGKSYCGRALIKALVPTAARHYRLNGYRWYHILPDGSISLDSILLKPQFWLNLAGGQR